METDKKNSNWRKNLTDEEFKILREKGTEEPFSGEYTENFEKGKYYCRACNQELFSSDAKYKSSTGWPSFYRPISDENIIIRTDYSHSIKRIEVLCNKCKSHLGHIFDDGPEPTGKRYCINSKALKFVKEK